MDGVHVKLISMDNQEKAGCLDFDDIITTIEKAFTDYQDGTIMLPDKISQIFNEEVQNRINCMPSTLFKDGVCGIKWVSVFPDNPHKYGLPNVSGIIILSEIERGLPFAIMDGTLITAARTACMGAIGAKYLARKDSKVYGTIGTGEQAKMHFRFIKSVYPGIKECYVASRTQEGENTFISLMSELYPDVAFHQCHSDYDKAAYNSDIVVTAVSSQIPLLRACSVKPGTYYCHVGGWEDEYAVPLKADKIVCDDWNALKHRGSPTIARMYKDGLLGDDDIYCDIKDIISKRKPGRESDDEFTYFNAIGLSFVDIAVAISFYDKAVTKGLYKDWDMWQA